MHKYGVQKNGFVRKFYYRQCVVGYAKDDLVRHEMGGT